MSGLWLPVKGGQDIFHGGVGDLGAGDKVPHGWSGVETLLAVVNKRINYVMKLQSFNESGRRGLQNGMLLTARLSRMLIMLASLGGRKKKQRGQHGRGNHHDVDERWSSLGIGETPFVCDRAAI